MTLPCSVEKDTACLRVAGDHVQWSARCPVRRDGFDALMKEVREIHHLGVRQACLMVGTVASRGTDAVPKPVPQDNRGSDEIRTAVCSLRGAPVTIDAVLRVDKSAPVRGGSIDTLTFGWACLDGKNCSNEESGKSLQ
jgi:hypothetical protein